MIGKREKGIASFILIIVAVILFIRNYYSFCWSDESLYMAEIHRLFLGGRPFMDEYNPTQFYSVFLLPFYHCYVKCNGSTEGIYLWVRNAYLLFLFLAAYLTAHVFRTKMKVCFGISIASGLFVIMYSRANVMGPSYHNVYYVLVLVATMLLLIEVLPADNKKGGSIYGILIGALYGMAAITIPTSVVNVLLTPVIGILIFAMKKQYFFRKQLLISIITGGMMTFLVYFAFVMSRISFVDFWENIFNVIIEDGYQVRNLKSYVYTFIDIVYNGKYILKLTIVAILLRTVFALGKREVPLLFQNILLLVSSIVLFYNLYVCANSHMSTYVIFGLYSVFLFVWMFRKEWIRDRLLCFEVIILGIIAIAVVLTFLFGSATSDTMSSGFVFLSLLTLLLFNKILEREGTVKQKTKIGIMVLICICAMAGITARIRIITVYRDAPLEQLDTKISRGPAKGLFTTIEHAKEYENCMDALDYIDKVDKGEGNSLFMVSKLAPWMYVATNIQNGSPTAWRCEISDADIEKYYRTHDIDNLRYILILKENYGGYLEAENMEGTDLFPNKNELSGYLWETLQTNRFEKIEMECGDLYIKK